MIINKKAYDLVLRASKSFELFIANFPFNQTILFRVRDKIILTFVAQLQSVLSITMNVKKIRLVISQVKLTTKITQTINVKRIRATYVFRQRMKAVSTILLRVEQTFVSKAIQKAVTTIVQGRFSLTIEPILATFFPLSEYDPDALSTMDTQTLQDLDYSAA